MVAGWTTFDTGNLEEMLPKAPYPMYQSGVINGQNSLYRFGTYDTEHPNLIIEDYIFDHKGNVITPGHYELALSDDKTFLILIESGNPIASFPVFKLETNEDQIEKPLTPKEAKKKEKEKKRQKKQEEKRKKLDEIIKTKYAETNATPPAEFVYMNATIEHIENGDYYIVKYEKKSIRAWGAFKR